MFIFCDSEVTKHLVSIKKQRSFTKAQDDKRRHSTIEKPTQFNKHY